MTTICGVAAATFKDPTPENVRAKKLTFVCDLCVSVMVFQLFFFFISRFWGKEERVFSPFQ